MTPYKLNEFRKAIENAFEAHNKVQFHDNKFIVETDKMAVNYLQSAFCHYHKIKIAIFNDKIELSI